MNQGLYSDTITDFHIKQTDQKQECTNNKVLQLATEYGLRSHYKDFVAFVHPDSAVLKLSIHRAGSRQACDID